MLNLIIKVFFFRAFVTRDKFNYIRYLKWYNARSHRLHTRCFSTPTKKKESQVARLTQPSSIYIQVVLMVKVERHFVLNFVLKAWLILFDCAKQLYYTCKNSTYKIANQNFFLYQPS